MRSMSERFVKRRFGANAEPMPTTRPPVLAPCLREEVRDPTRIRLCVFAIPRREAGPADVSEENRSRVHRRQYTKVDKPPRGNSQHAWHRAPSVGYELRRVFHVGIGVEQVAAVPVESVR